METVSKPPKEPLRAIPEYVLVNLRKKYDVRILRAFYYHMMVKCFPLEAELDPFDVMERRVRGSSDRLFVELYQMDCLLDRGLVKGVDPEMHVDLYMLPNYQELLDSDDGTNNYEKTAAALIGGVVWEYYPRSNSGMMSYFCIDEKYRGMGFSKKLTRLAYKQCLDYVSTFPNVQQKKPFGFYAETNAIDVYDGVLKSSERHKILNAVGFRTVECEYIQAPLSDDTPEFDGLVLLLYCADKLRAVEKGAVKPGKIPMAVQYVPTDEFGPMERPESYTQLAISSESIVDFVSDYYGSVAPGYEELPCYQHVKADVLSRGPLLPLRNLPWNFVNTKWRKMTGKEHGVDLTRNCVDVPLNSM